MAGGKTDTTARFVRNAYANAGVLLAMNAANVLGMATKL
jgi:hypothetical protein